MAFELTKERIEVIGYMTLNFVVSVVIIWANKLAYQHGFKWAITLTALHFLFTFIGLEICARYNMFERKALPVLSVLPISLAFCGFVVFNNLSLQYNSVGMYQLMKVMTTPTIVIIQWVMYKSRIPTIQIISLIPVCIGVILATVSSIDMNFIGSVFGTLGIISTSVYQIWVKTEQENLKCNSQQLLYYQSLLSGIILIVLIPFLEDVTGLINTQFSLTTLFWVFLSALLAFLVNLSIFLVIGKTSPISYNVLGHGKLCVILVSGYTLFGDSANAKNIMGVCMAVIGIVWYTHLKLQPTGAAPAAPKGMIPIPTNDNDEFDKLTSEETSGKV
jgi:solute carrier family 35 protein E3